MAQAEEYPAPWSGRSAAPASTMRPLKESAPVSLFFLLLGSGLLRSRYNLQHRLFRLGEVLRGGSLYLLRRDSQELLEFAIQQARIAIQQLVLRQQARTGGCRLQVSNART